MDSHDKPKGPLTRLRVPAALAVAFVGSSAVISMWYGGCHTGTPDPPDAQRIESERDAGNKHADAEVVDAGPSDAGFDAPADARPDTPPV